MYQITLLIAALFISGCQTVTYFDSVPTAQLIVGKQAQGSKVGSYCWPFENGTICADASTWPTSSKPIIVKSPVDLKIDLPIPKKIKHVEYMVTKVTRAQLSDNDIRSHTSFWNIPVENVIPMSTNGLKELTLALEPGVYAITVFAWWTDIGDSTHGFLIEVKP